MATVSAYKSKLAQEKALANYEKILARWPVPYQVHFINTSYGATHVLVCGTEKTRPLVLLHGGGGNSTMWIHNIVALAQHFKIYAIDIIGEAGKSAGTRPSFKSEGYCHWLNEVFTGLNIKQAALCGASLGGTLALQFALLFPQRVTSLALLAPPSIFKMRAGFLMRVIFANLFPSSFMVRSFLNYISARGSQLSDATIDNFTVQFRAYKPNRNIIPLIADVDFARLPRKRCSF